MQQPVLRPNRQEWSGPTLTISPMRQYVFEGCSAGQRLTDWSNRGWSALEVEVADVHNRVTIVWQ